MNDTTDAMKYFFADPMSRLIWTTSENLGTWASNTAVTSNTWEIEVNFDSE